MLPPGVPCPILNANANDVYTQMPFSEGQDLESGKLSWVGCLMRRVCFGFGVSICCLGLSFFDYETASLHVS